MDRPLVIRHGACRDGFCASWVIRMKFPDAEFFDGFYGQPAPLELAQGRDVIVVDFSYPRAEMMALARAAGSLAVIDHHKTAEEVLEDRDLWRLKLPETKAVNAYIGTLEFDFAAWMAASTTAAQDCMEGYDRTYSAARAGRHVEAKTEQYVREVSKNARKFLFHGHAVPLVNAPQVDISELLDRLCAGEVFAMGWWQRSDGVFQYSLRSRGDFDVSELAKLHGGGGHRNAAGFQSDELLP